MQYVELQHFSLKYVDFTVKKTIYLHYDAHFKAKQLVNLERVEKSGDNCSLSADFLADSSHIMAGVSPVRLEF